MSIDYHNSIVGNNRTSFKDEEEKKEYINKYAATLKASNEMLDEAKEECMNVYKDDLARANYVTDKIEQAKGENLLMAKSYLGATPDDLKNIQYKKDADDIWKKKYNDYLKKRNMTDEEMRNKKDNDAENVASAVATASSHQKSKISNLIDKLKTKKTEEDVKNEEKRSVKGIGFVEDDKKETLNNEIMEIIEKDKKKNEKDVEEPQKIDKEVKEKENDALKIKNNTIKTFNVKDIPQNVQFDIVPLPSKGECYASKVDRIPVRYLTASDENLIASPNMYANGEIVDAILKRCIYMSEEFIDNMCKGDRDAVMIFLRTSAYGPQFEISAKNPTSGKSYNTIIDLSTLKVIDFNLKGDENGYFTYKCNNGDVIKYRLLTQKDYEKIAIKNEAVKHRIRLNDIKKYMDFIKEYIETNDYQNEEDKDMLNVLEIVNEWYKSHLDKENIDEEKLYDEHLTDLMKAITISINENSDRDFIEKYIESQRIKDSRDYREYAFKNVPGIDFNITINIPESDGGGSFETFLGLSDTFFIE